MTMPLRSLRQLQQWMQSVVTFPGGVADGVASEAARRALGDGESTLETVVPPSATQSSLERLAVYGNAYFGRLLNCLHELFPACRHAVGDEVFAEFAYGYLLAHPPTSYTLGDLAQRFVAFLDETRTAELDDSRGEGREACPSVEPAPSWSSFLVELAQLELTIDAVFDGPGSEGEPLPIAGQLNALPPGAWPAIRLQPARCLRLLNFEFPVNDYFSAFRRGEQPEWPDPAPCFLAITRRDYVVRRFQLEPLEYRVLGVLVGGATVAEAVAAAAASDGGDVASRLSRWFRRWASLQFFTAVQSASYHFMQEK